MAKHALSQPQRRQWRSRVAAVACSRLPASSLVEVTVAATLLVLVLALAFAISARLALSGPNPLKLRSQQAAAQLAAETIRRRAWHACTVVQGAIEVQQMVTTFPDKPYLYKLEVVSLVQERPVYTFTQLVYAPPVPAL